MAIEILSPPDKVQLTRAVFQRWCRLLQKAKSIHENVDIPPSVHRAINLWNAMNRRYKTGLYLHTQPEADAEQEICRWLISEWSRIVKIAVRNRPTRKA